MVVLRCTQQLLFRLKQLGEEPRVRSTTRLGDWHGNLLRMGNRHAALFISERSRLPVLIPIREASRLRMTFPDAVGLALAALGVPVDAVEQERLQVSEVALGRTSSRSLPGSLTDFSFSARTRFITDRRETLEHIVRSPRRNAADRAVQGSSPDHRHAHAVRCAMSHAATGRRASLRSRHFPGALGRVQASLAGLGASRSGPARRAPRAGTHRIDAALGSLSAYSHARKRLPLLAS
jgi:hypothetical protein